MKYHELLTKFISLSELKVKDIASELNYDNSYVSKWINGKNIPSLKSYCEINLKLSYLFAPAIFMNDNAEKVYVLSEKKVPVTLSTLRYTIHGLLQDAYFKSAGDFNINGLQLKEREVFIGQDEILENLQRITSQVFANLTEPLHVITSSDYIFTLTFGNHMRYICYTTRSIPVKYTIIVNTASIQNLLTSFTAFLNLTLQFGYYKLEVFFTDDKLESHTTLFGDDAILFFELDINREPILMLASNNKWLMDHNKKTLLPYYEKQRSVVCSTNDYDTEIYALKKLINPDNGLIMYLSSFSCHLLPEETLKKLFIKHNISEHQIEKFYKTRDLYFMLINSMKTKVILSEMQMFDVATNRNVDFCGKEIKLTRGEMSEYISSLKVISEENDSVEYYFDRTMDKSINFGSLRVSFIASNELVYFVRDSSTVDELTMRYVIYDHPIITETFIKYMNNQFEKNEFEKIESDELPSLFERVEIFNNGIRP